jgi:hypothetical protein
MVRLALANLHPTVLAKTVTQRFVTCATHNQIYWQVDGNTLLARYHLLFMLAIRPEVPLGLVSFHCDYGFVPTLVPSGQLTILDDSDQFFILELQAREQENWMLRCGQATPRQIAQELSTWTTAEHRRFAADDLVFHSGDIPAATDNARGGLATFMSQLQAGLSAVPPLSHVDHFYWLTSAQAWAALKRFNDPGFSPPPELNTTVTARSKRVLRSYFDLLARADRLAGAMPNVPIWNYQWLDSRFILSWVQAAKRAAGRNLLICEPTSALAGPLRSMLALDVVASLDQGRELVDAADDVERSRAEPLYDHILIHCDRTNIQAVQSLLNWTMKQIKPTGAVAIFIQHANWQFDATDFSTELAVAATQLVPPEWVGYRVTARFASGYSRKVLRTVERVLLRNLMISRLSRLPLAVSAALLWPCVAILTTVNNLRLRNRSEACLPFCSSALLSVERYARTVNGRQ